MAADEELTRFVREALGKGLRRAKVEEVLLLAGWEEAQVRNALAAYADLDFPLPVPRPKPYLSPQEVFLCLVLFTALYLSAFHLGSLVFRFIEAALPDPADMDPHVRETLRWSVSYLIIAFPLFLYVARILARNDARAPAAQVSPVRKWLTYLTLFLAAGALVGDATALVYNLLSGELTPPFLLKVLAVAAIAGGIFGHYLGELRRDEQKGPLAPASHRFLWVSSGAVVLALGGSFLQLDAPAQERVRRLDNRRVEDLRHLAGAVDLYWSRRGTLPGTLEALTEEQGFAPQAADPTTGQPYEYHVLGARAYELCAEFERPSEEGELAGFWSHGAGRHCFQFEAKKSAR
ncbi:MAG: hypothetical protein FJY95_08955 [Candidatus Handelsmanbacteria bacterium]|nr:hypothetical protein [Candidatus Handelsmanbacteria bacterium]